MLFSSIISLFSSKCKALSFSSFTKEFCLNIFRMGITDAAMPITQKFFQKR